MPDHKLLTDPRFTRLRTTADGKKQIVLVNARDAHSANAAKFQCWRVEFEWYKGEFDLFPKRAVIFVRAPNHALSGIVAAKIWEMAIRPDPFEDYPKMQDASQTRRIPDSEFLKLWKYCKDRDPLVLRVGGTDENPRAFWPRGICQTSKDI